jgi:competence protein ComEC
LVGVCSAERAFARYRTDRMDVVFAAVGQGDATVLRMPGGEVVVVDGGPPGRGRSAVAPLLRRMGIGRIDVLVATHVQDDHWGGLPELAEELEIAELWHPGGTCTQPRFAELVDSLRSRGVRVTDVGAALAAAHAAGAGRPAIRRRGEAGWTLRALWPREAHGRCDANDRSVVVLAAFGRSRLLLGGDVEHAAEHAIARLGRLRAGVLKAPHHGSRTSSSDALLDAVRPALSVVSCGTLNRYGFPHPQVSARYAARGVPLLRTDRAGAIQVRAYRNRLVIEPVRGESPTPITLQGGRKRQPPPARALGRAMTFGDGKAACGGALTNCPNRQ